MYVRIVMSRAQRMNSLPIASSFRLGRLQAAKCPHEIGHGRANLNRAVFLNEMDALHCDFRLIRPSAAELALTAMIERAEAPYGSKASAPGCARAIARTR